MVKHGCAAERDKGGDEIFTRSFTGIKHTRGGRRENFAELKALIPTATCLKSRSRRNEGRRSSPARPVECHEKERVGLKVMAVLFSRKRKR